MRNIFVTMLLVALPLGSMASPSGTFSFAVSKEGKIQGRMDVRIRPNEGIIYASSSLIPGAAAVKERKKGKMSVRSYAELESDGTVGKFKRWEGEQYWFAFVYENVLKVRYEKDPKAAGDVRTLGKVKASPLDLQQPHLAWIAATLASGPDGDCVTLRPAKAGKFSIEKGSELEEIEGMNGRKIKGAPWKVTGDCGDYHLWVNERGRPVLMVADDHRFDLMP